MGGRNYEEKKAKEGGSLNQFLSLQFFSKLDIAQTMRSKAAPGFVYYQGFGVEGFKIGISEFCLD